MGKYIIKRILMTFFILLVIITITFFLMNMVPGGPFTSDRALSIEVKEALMKKFNLDKPLFVQYVMYIINLLHGDMGVSIKTLRPVSEIIFSSFGVSLKIGIFAIIVSLVCGVALGIFCALNRGTIIDNAIVVLTTFVVSVPSFVIASTLLLIFCVKLKWVPVWSQQTQHIILPIIAMSFGPTSVIIKYMRSSMLEVLGEDYIRTARAKGLSKFRVIFVHALKNAVIPIITYLGPLTAGMITGSVVIENIFTIGGLGTEFLNCIETRDYPLILGITIFYSILLVLMNLVSDILYKVVDPRIDFD